MPEEIQDDLAPVSMELILDGAAFIRGMATKNGLHKEDTVKGAVYIKEVGLGAANEVIVGQYRVNKEGNSVYDGLATMDRCICMAIQECVVKDTGESVFSAANILFMYSGPNQAAFRDFLTELYDLVIKWNPHLHPSGNVNALRRLRPWMA